MSVRRTAAQARPVAVESRLQAVLKAGVAGEKQPLHKAADVSVTSFRDKYGYTQVIIPRQHWELYARHQFQHSLRDRASERELYKAEVSKSYWLLRDQLFEALESPGFTHGNFVYLIRHPPGFAMSPSQPMDQFYELNEDEIERLEDEFFAGRMTLEAATEAFVEYAMQNAPAA